MLTSREKQNRLSHRQSSAKWQLSPTRPSSSSVRSGLQRGSYPKASDEDQENVLDVAMKLILIRLRLCLRMELAHRFYKTEDTRLRETSCRGARFS